MSTSLLREFDTEILLDRLDDERRKFSQADDVVIRSLVEELVRRDEYREPIGTPHEVKPFVPFPTPLASEGAGGPGLESICKAVWGYCARWHRFREPLCCPLCQVDLRDHENGPPFKREIGRIERDRVAGWNCPDCGKAFS